MLLLLEAGADAMGHAERKAGDGGKRQETVGTKTDDEKQDIDKYRRFKVYIWLLKF